MNIVTWQLIPNQYQIDIILVYTKQSYYDTIKLLNNKFQFGLEEGIDFDTFFNCNLQINSQGKALAKKIFNAIKK